MHLSYTAISNKDISIEQLMSILQSILVLLSIKVWITALNKVVKYLFYFIVYPFYMADHLVPMG